jgi:hypothetical protein
MLVPFYLLPLGIVGAYVLKSLWAITFFRCGFTVPVDSEVISMIEKRVQEWKSFSFLPTLGYALVEEMTFRVYPVMGAQFLIENVSETGFWLGLALVMGAQLVFGMVHGNWRNIGMQGMSGFIYLGLFIAFGGLDPNTRIVGLFASTAVHTLWNLNCMYKFNDRFRERFGF